MSIHNYYDLEIVLDGDIYQCSGQLEYEYNPGDTGGPTSEPYCAYASGIFVHTLDEITKDADNEDGYITICDPSSELSEKLCKAIVDTYEEDDSPLIEEWEGDAMELAASNRYDEYIERTHDDY